MGEKITPYGDRTPGERSRHDFNTFIPEDLDRQSNIPEDETAKAEKHLTEDDKLKTAAREKALANREADREERAQQRILEGRDMFDNM